MLVHTILPNTFVEKTRTKDKPRKTLANRERFFREKDALPGDSERAAVHLLFHGFLLFACFLTLQKEVDLRLTGMRLELS